MIDSPLNGKKILVVDDEVQLRQAIIFDLKRRGCEIFEAGNGYDAIALVKSNSIDVVVSDVKMPNGDGVSLLREIKNHNSKLPHVLLCTGFADLTEAEAKKMGAIGLIEKPIDRKNMLELLERIFL